MRPQHAPTRTSKVSRKQPTMVEAYEVAVQAEVLEPAEMELAVLVHRCVAESSRFYNGQPHDTRFAYELFRRALVDCNDMAWYYLYTHYSPLVENWVRRCGAFQSSGESSESFVTLAFARFWRAVTSKGFESFTSLAALLHYLQMCTSCVVIDSVRAQSWAEVLPEPMLAAAPALQTAPDEEAMERVNREDFWNYINAQLNDEAERVVVSCSFVLGMKPGDIFQRRPDLFESVRDVYSVKRNVLERLGRNQELRCYLGQPYAEAAESAPRRSRAQVRAV